MNELATLIKRELNDAVPSAVKEAFKEILDASETMTSAQTALQLCEVFTNKITIVIKEKQLQNGLSVEKVFKRRHRNTTKEQEKDLMVFATQVLYTLRQFFTEQEIVFHIGVTDNQHRFVREAYIPQREVMRRLAVGGNSTKNMYVGLLGQMEAYLTELSTQHETEEYISHWKLVEFLSSIESEDIDYDSKLTTSQGETAFGKQTEDTSVYATTKWVNQKQNIKARYYNLQGNQLFYFNQGWLWQWYDTILNSSDESTIQLVHWDLRQGSIRSLFRTYDNVPGIKQGDYTNLQGQQIQNKYNNQRIMSYKNILMILAKLKIYLSNYIAATNPAQSSQALTAYLIETFFPETLSRESELVAQTVENLINKLNK